jgi:FHA domain
MDSFVSHTIIGGRPFRCQDCGYVQMLTAADTLRECSACHGQNLVAASLVSTAGTATEGPYNSHIDNPIEPPRLLEIREEIEQPGDYLAFIEDGHEKVVALTSEWTRIGRSLTGDLRLDDPTVSRRHALLGRQPDGVRLLDDRSLNGVFVNGESVESTILQDGDEIELGRYRLNFISLTPNPNQPRSTDPAPMLTSIT